MRISRTLAEPSRTDAVRMNRSEKMSMIVLAYIATVFDETRDELSERLGMLPDGKERMQSLSEETDTLLQELRMTIPMNQRMNLQNTACDFEIRLTPKASPTKTTVIMQKDEFKELVDCAREKCAICVEDDESCEKCKLFQLLTCILPVDDYHGQTLCPYNLGEWGN